MTFQAYDIDEAKYLYDQLVPVCPILVRSRPYGNAYLISFQLALSAETPAYRGYLVDTDCRWDVIAGGCDCRTPEERGLKVVRTYGRGYGGCSI